MKKIFLGLVTISLAIAFTNFAVANHTTDSTYTQIQNKDEKCNSGKCNGK